MDENLRGQYESTSFEDETSCVFSDSITWLNASETMLGCNRDVENLRGADGLSTFSYPNLIESERVFETSVEQNNLKDLMLSYINQMLMEDDIEEKAYALHQSAALKDAERSLYEVIGEKYPPSPDLHRVPDLQQSECSSGYQDSDNCEENAYALQQSAAFKDAERSLYKVIGVKYPHSPDLHQVPDLQQSECYSGDQNSDNCDLLCPSWVFDPENEGNVDFPSSSLLIQDNVSRGKKNTHREEIDSPEGRVQKHAAISVEPSFEPEVFDEVLLWDEDEENTALCRAIENVSCVGENEVPRGKTGRKRQGRKRDVVDLRGLLTLCAQAVAAGDRITGAYEYLKQIRQHSSPTGDDMQRLSHYFADALEARISGSGARIHKALVKYPRSGAMSLKAYHLYLSSSPFRKITNFFSNKTITNLARNSTSLHIIDFGSLFGFQWPCLLQRLSARPGGPPKVRITAIDMPIPGFRPADRVHEIGRLLTHYAEKFKVPFEFNAMAQKWETIAIEDLKIRRDESLVVNCLYRLRTLLDETVVVNALNPRDTVLKLIHDLRPDVFIHGVLNGAYDAPFFILRFRAALSHYSAMFDMLEATIPREVHERELIESFIFGRQAMNVIACEGAERIERPETYKQWQVRNSRAGFVQLPLNREIVVISSHCMKKYHKDFVIDEDGKWLHLGWKGRTLYALSSWKPA